MDPILTESNLVQCLPERWREEVQKFQTISQIAKSGASAWEIMWRTGLPYSTVWNIGHGRQRHRFVQHWQRMRAWLPIYPSPQLAEFAGHLMGDGHLGEKYCYLILRPCDVASHRVLFENFCVTPYVEKTKSDKVVSLRFNGHALCTLLRVLGVPRGRKATTRFSVPRWILKGDRSLQVSFLRAMLSDEAEAPRAQPRSSGMHFTLAKSASDLESGLGFISQLRSMLYSFGVETSTLRTSPDKLNSGETFYKIGFLIKPRRINLLRYATTIGFCYLEKQLALRNVVLDILESLKVDLEYIEKRRKAIELRKTGLSYEEIGKKVGAGCMSTWHWVNADRGLPIPERDFDWFQENYERIQSFLHS